MDRSPRPRRLIVFVAAPKNSVVFTSVNCGKSRSTSTMVLRCSACMSARSMIVTGRGWSAGRAIREPVTRMRSASSSSWAYAGAVTPTAPRASAAKPTLHRNSDFTDPCA